MLLEEARRVLAVVDQAKASVKSAAAGYRGRIRVALSDGIPQARLAALLPGVEVVSSAERGLPPQQVEAAAFAWLAQAAVRRQPGNLASVTGARGARVLGAIYAA